MAKKEFKRLQKFIDGLAEYELAHQNEIDPVPPTDAATALNCITEALLGPDYYVVFPMGAEQCNTVILDEILRTYSRDYRRLVKKKQKELRRNGQ